MIGVLVQPGEQEAARELFELCKTPWEFFRNDARYHVVIGTSLPPVGNAPLVLLYSTECTAFETGHGISINCRQPGITVTHDGRSFPIYGAAATFPTGTVKLVQEKVTKEAVLFAQRDGEHTVIRIGYNIFAETAFLLSEGQPTENAGQPTLELHLALLRDLVTRAGLPFVEIPPVPDGHDLIVCLTHDIDHPLIRKHFFDHTMFGFFFRASVGSLLNVARKKMSFGNMWKNWLAAVRLPFIHLGLSKDIWLQFDHYLKIEAGLGSTYFVIPRMDYPGQAKRGKINAKRACRYALADIVPELKKVMLAGNEVGLHGLDAWQDAKAGRNERAMVSQAMGLAEIGVRMHWLYFDRNSPAELDQSGFTYDSTVGYNETVGFRAGTAQVYRPLGTNTLLELPLVAMDTALFYPSYLNLGEGEAYDRVIHLLDDIMKQGGALTLNWHDRSIAPERLWDKFYLKIITEFKRRGAWFPTAARAVAWFKLRREATVEFEHVENDMIAVRGRCENRSSLPGLRIRIHKPRQRTPGEALASDKASAFFLDVKLDNTAEIKIRI